MGDHTVSLSRAIAGQVPPKPLAPIIIVSSLILLLFVYPSTPSLQPTLLPMRFTWLEEWGGSEVSVTGEFNHWSQHIRMTRSTEDDNPNFHCVIMLPEGSFMVKYIVDGQWR